MGVENHQPSITHNNTHSIDSIMKPFDLLLLIHSISEVRDPCVGRVSRKIGIIYNHFDSLFNFYEHSVCVRERDLVCVVCPTVTESALSSTFHK